MPRILKNFASAFLKDTKRQRDTIRTFTFVKRRKARKKVAPHALETSSLTD